ncbi:MAG: metal ABC transporter permease, partial [Microbacteriaceae bacterium]
FDAEFATTLGLRTKLLNASFMFLVSFTVTTAFHEVGAILIIALMIVPAATAYLMSKQLNTMIWLTLILAATSSLAGFYLAYILGAPTSAGIAVFYGFVFAVVFVVTRIRVLVLRQQSKLTT